MVILLFDNIEMQQGSSTTSTDITTMSGDTNTEVNFLYDIHKLTLLSTVP